MCENSQPKWSHWPVIIWSQVHTWCRRITCNKQIKISRLQIIPFKYCTTLCNSVTKLLTCAREWAGHIFFYRSCLSIWLPIICLQTQNIAPHCSPHSLPSNTEYSSTLESPSFALQHRIERHITVPILCLPTQNIAPHYSPHPLPYNIEYSATLQSSSFAFQHRI
jgi:hypothetical protein